MNWGYKIMIVIICFIVIMIGMVTFACQQKNEMVDSNYYEAEINYQSMINAAKNINDITSDSLLTTTSNRCILHIPVSLVKGFKEGKIELLKSSDQRLDKTIQFHPDVNGLFEIDLKEMAKGNYSAKVTWTSDNKKYYREQIIMLN